MKYHIVTYGCQMNKSDSERIAGILEKIGFRPAETSSRADLIVINMCSVRQSAVDRVYAKIQNLKHKMQNKKSKNTIILTGCIVKPDVKKLKDRVDYILSIKDLSNWPKFLKDKNLLIRSEQINKAGKNYFRIKPKYQNNFSAFVPISNGCNNFCSYCVVPYVRGPLVCRPYEEILEKVKNLIKKGYKEIWLLGQNVNDYRSLIGANKSPISRIKKEGISEISAKFARISAINFAQLLKMVNSIPGNFWIRFTSPHPTNFSDELIEMMAKCQKVTPYLNLPVQSGNDEILRKMNRPYTIEQYKVLVKKLRAAFKKYREGLEKEVAISTDVIVGFPGETKKQFRNTAELMKEIKFDMAYIAQYSPRPQTAAFKLKDNVPVFEKQKRERELTKILEKSALKFNRKFLDKTVEILVNEKKKDFYPVRDSASPEITPTKKSISNGVYLGKTRHHQTIKIKSDKNILGDFAKVKVIKIMPYGLEGKLIE